MSCPESDFWETPGRKEQLRQLWAEGLSMAAIGRRMGVSKNAVVGKARRMGLSGRPSPIIVTGAPRKRRSPRAMGNTLPVVASSAKPEPVEPPALKVVFKPLASHFCCWPLGDPGTKSFRFCDEPSRPGKPYCEDHCAVAYVKMQPTVRDNRLYLSERESRPA